MLRILLTAYVICTVLPQAFPQKPLNIGQSTLELFDSSRTRPVKTEIWYPTEDTINAPDQVYTPFIRTATVRNATPVKKEHPLILMSHGTGGGRLTMQWLAAGLVKQGYIVAAVDHWGNTFDNTIPENFLKFWERPVDISFALTAIQKSNTFGPLIDTSRIGAVGFSLGGYTVLALAGGRLDFAALHQFIQTPEGKIEATVPELPQLPRLLEDELMVTALIKAHKNVRPKDERITAVMAIAPAVGQGFQVKSQVEDIAVPIFIVGAEGDRIAPVKTNAMHYHKLVDHSQFFLFEGEVGHYAFLNEAREELQNEGPVYFKDHESVSRAEVHDKTIELAITFFQEALPQN